DPFFINAAISDAWFFSDTNGQGFFIIVYEDSKSVFLAWFTFETEDRQAGLSANVGEPFHRWLIGQGPFDGDTALLEVFLASGMVFDSDEFPVDLVKYEDAIIKIVWTDCETGLLEYNIPTLGLMGVIPIQRVAADKVAACEAAQAQ
ncbi:MAG: hypothetical protein IID60_09085, partial [Proteobacteria bacterium]|nr:hypothetical protein [Pseudomonadota bacterium]